MTFTDWLIDLALIAIVLRQLRWAQLDRRFVLIPLVLVGVTAHSYLHTIPTAGNDPILIGLFLAIGLALGIVGGFTTLVRVVAPGEIRVRASALAASLWVGSMTARLVFIVWATHGGADALGRFSAQHSITAGSAWTAALVLMALAEVISRIGLICFRGYRLRELSRIDRPAFARA
jgi:hypothetical protein